MKIFKKLLAAVLSALIITVTAFCVSAQEIKPYSETGTVISVAHGGNWGEYRIYSKEAIESAFELGADCVSISVKKTADGKFVLTKDDDLGKLYTPYKGKLISEMTYDQVMSVRVTDTLGALTGDTLSSLDDAVDVAVRFNSILILDDCWDCRNELYSYLVDANALQYVYLRTDASKGDINEFINNTSGMFRIIGKYHGNIIFNAKSYVKKLSDCKCSAVQLATSNPYGVIFHQTMLSAFSKNSHKTRAMISTYDPDMCGQRTDTESTWDDLIARGYSVIETNDIASLTAYISRIATAREELKAMTSQLDKLNQNNCSAKTLKEISDAKADATEVLKKLSSYETLVCTKGKIKSALNNFSVTNDDHVKKGVLKISVGKIIAVVFVTAGIVAGQIYTYKMQKRKKSKK